MIWMLWRLRYAVIGAAFLCLVVLHGRAGVFSWVFVPLVSGAAFLVYSDYLHWKNPEHAHLLVGKSVALIAIYTLAFIIMPWLMETFPEVSKAARNYLRITDVKEASKIDPCLTSVQVAVHSFSVEIEKVHGKQVESDLSNILQDVGRGSSNAEDISRRQGAVLEKIRQFAQNRAEWQSVLSVCESIKEPPKGPLTSAGPELAPSTLSPGSTLPKASTKRQQELQRYLTRSAVADTLFVFAPNTNPAIEAQLTSAFQASSGLFTPAFFGDGLFARVYAGDLAVLDQLQLSITSVLFACQSSAKASQGDSPAPDLKQSEVRLTCRRFDMARRSSRVVDVAGVGAGFTDDAAFRLGVERAVQALKDQLQ